MAYRRLLADVIMHSAWLQEEAGRCGVDLTAGLEKSVPYVEEAPQHLFVRCNRKRRYPPSRGVRRIQLELGRRLCLSVRHSHRGPPARMRRLQTVLSIDSPRTKASSEEWQNSKPTTDVERGLVLKVLSVALEDCTANLQALRIVYENSLVEQKTAILVFEELIRLRNTRFFLSNPQFAHNLQVD